MKKKLIVFSVITFFHLGLTITAWSILFSRGMNEVPRTTYDEILSVADLILEFPLSLYWQQANPVVSFINSAIWAGVLMISWTYLFRPVSRAT